MVVSIGNPMTLIIGASGLGKNAVFVTYILQSQKDGLYYIGSTNNIADRLMRHNKGYSRYTRMKGPFSVVYKEEYKTLSEAKRREYYLKSLKSRVAIEKLIKHGSIV